MGKCGALPLQNLVIMLNNITGSISSPTNGVTEKLIIGHHHHHHHPLNINTKRKGHSIFKRQYVYFNNIPPNALSNSFSITQKVCKNTNTWTLKKVILDWPRSSMNMDLLCLCSSDSVSRGLRITSTIMYSTLRINL